MNENSRISLSLTASDVSRFNDWLDDKCAACGLDTALAADIKLCLNEVLANLMSYGLKQTPQPLTVVDLTLQPGERPCGSDGQRGLFRHARLGDAG